MIGLRSFIGLGSWCRGLTCLPVTEEIAGSNPVEPAKEKTSTSRWGFFFGRASALDSNRRFGEEGEAAIRSSPIYIFILFKYVSRSSVVSVM